MRILINGCSFSRGPISWPYYLAGLTDKTSSNVVNLACAGTLQEHKKQGYQTFDRWWSEEYDDYGEQLRIYKIQEIITEIMSWDKTRLHQTYKEMQPILEHNRNLYFAKQG